MRSCAREIRWLSRRTGPDANDKRLEFKYDHLGRRVEKSYQVYNGSAWVTQAGYPQRYVYDDWNVVLTLDGSNNNQIVRKSTWGLDLSGGLHGAGGIGGLLASAERAGESWNYYWYFYDGNGNVTQVIEPPAGSGCSASATVCDWLPQILCGLSGEDGEEETPAGEDGLESALSGDGMSVMTSGPGGGGGGPPAWLLTHYEYDPYGNILYSYGSYANVNPFRFSTKWLDVETGLYYYGYRYYSTRLGRWLSRDPIGERGGGNLLAFVSNRAVNAADPLGLDWVYPIILYPLPGSTPTPAPPAASPPGPGDGAFYIGKIEPNCPASDQPTVVIATPNGQVSQDWLNPEHTAAISLYGGTNGILGLADACVQFRIAPNGPTDIDLPGGRIMNVRKDTVVSICAHFGRCRTCSVDKGIVTSLVIRFEPGGFLVRSLDALKLRYAGTNQIHAFEYVSKCTCQCVCPLVPYRIIDEAGNQFDWPAGGQ